MESVCDLDSQHTLHAHAHRGEVHLIIRVSVKLMLINTFSESFTS